MNKTRVNKTRVNKKKNIQKTRKHTKKRRHTKRRRHIKRISRKKFSFKKIRHYIGGHRLFKDGNILTSVPPRATIKVIFIRHLECLHTQKMDRSFSNTDPENNEQNARNNDIKKSKGIINDTPLVDPISPDDLKSLKEIKIPKHDVTFISSPFLRAKTTAAYLLPKDTNIVVDNFVLPELKTTVNKCPEKEIPKNDKGMLEEVKFYDKEYGDDLDLSTDQKYLNAFANSINTTNVVVFGVSRWLKRIMKFNKTKDIFKDIFNENLPNFGRPVFFLLKINTHGNWEPEFPENDMNKDVRNKGIKL